jgi:hypothetical protein
MMSLRHFRIDDVFDAIENRVSQRRRQSRCDCPSARPLACYDAIYVGDAAADILAAREADQVAERLLEAEALADVLGGLALLDPDLVELAAWRRILPASLIGAARVRARGASLE